MNKIFLQALALGTAAMLFACDDDETSYAVVDGALPTISMESKILAEPGRQFTIEATIKDNDGLKSIRLVNDEFYLDKTIDLIATHKEVLNEYQLKYGYKPDTTFVETDKTVVTVTATDVLGNETTQNVTIQMNGDFTAPSFSVAPSDEIFVLLKDETKLKLGFTAIDDKALGKISISIPDLDYNSEVTQFADAKKYVYSEFISVPSKLAEYEMVVELTDTAGYTTSKESVINVSELIDFPKLYLSDVETADELNSDLFGVPMLIDHGTEPFTYVAHYYASKANQGIRILPQKTNFDPVCFAADVNDKSKLGSEYDATEPIVLPEVGYYEININTKEWSYSVEKWEPKVVEPGAPEANGAYKQASLKTANPLPSGIQYYLDDAQDYTSSFELALAGSGIPGIGSWSTSNALVLTQDKTNPYIWTGETQLEAKSEVEFTITPRHDWGWWPEPFFRFESGDNDSQENEYNTRNGGNNMVKVVVPKTGKYRFVFDTALMRSKFILID